MGDNDHAWFANLVRDYLPQRIRLDTGFVVNHQSDRQSLAHEDSRSQDKGIGPQTDILLVDVMDNAPLCVEQTFRVYPVEMVLGAVEVTRFLDKTKLDEDLTKLSRVRELAQEKRYAYVHHPSAPRRRPKAYVVGFRSSLSEDAIRESVSAIHDDLRPNALLLLDKCLYVRQPNTVDFWRIEEDPLFHFLAILRYQIETFPRGGTDLSAYLPPVAVLASDQPSTEPICCTSISRSTSSGYP
jgi:hypothetical protein